VTELGLHLDSFELIKWLLPLVFRPPNLMFASLRPDLIGSNCLGNCSIFPSRAILLNDKQEKVPYQLVGIVGVARLYKQIEERKFLEIALLEYHFIWSS